eukprot:gene13017-13146_t
MSDAAGLADLIDASEAPAQASISLVDADIIDASVTADAAPAKVQDSSAEQLMKVQEAKDDSEKQVATKATDVNEAPANDPEVVNPQRSVSELRKQLTSGGGSSPSAADAATAAATPAAPSPVPGGERSSSPTLSPHDKVNTTNVAALLQASEFKLRPGVDEVPYEQLVGLRLEDGIDVTRKEEYLSAEDFKKVIGLDQEAYSKLPQWKKLQIKRQVNLF